MIITKLSKGLRPLAFFFLLSCSPKPPDIKDANPLTSDLAKAGRTTYLSHCIACHNPDPKLDGSVGPKLHAVSEKVLYAKLMTGSYPEGYKPKRGTRMMPPMPFLEEEIKALTAFLNEP